MDRGIIDTLCLGERVVTDGHVVERCGLCGAGAFLVNGVPCSADEAVGGVPDQAPPVAEQLAKPRRARVAAARAAARSHSKAAPELLAETRDALKGDRGLAFQHRAFAGGEAVTVRLGEGAPAGERVIAKLCGTGLYAERGPDGSVVVAWTKAVLTGDGPAKKKVW